MGKIALVFAGQGAQYPGMGNELYHSSPAAKKVFDMCESLRPGTKDQCFEGTKEELSQTVNTQPCLFALDLAAAAALSEKGIKADMAAGFSLGELAACAYTGMLSPDDAFRLVCKRAELMSDCASRSEGAMLAVLGLPDKKVEELCSEIENAYPVNYNCPGQVVVSIGCFKDNSSANNNPPLNEAVSLLSDSVKISGGRSVRLAVSGAFHSPFMSEASKAFFTELGAYRLNNPEIPLFSNVTALPYSGDYKTLLSKQISSPVLWRNTIINMQLSGADIFIEAGAGKVLSGLIAKTIENASIYRVEDQKTLEQTVYALSH